MGSPFNCLHGLIGLLEETLPLVSGGLSVSPIAVPVYRDIMSGVASNIIPFHFWDVKTKDTQLWSEACFRGSLH